MDPRKSYLSLISIEKSSVHLDPPIVFLFGGKVGSEIQSVRSILYNHISLKEPSLSQRLIIPENFKDWLHDSVYPDLLSFESDLAQASSLIVIALECPGAIAELGSFSVNSDLRDKVVVIISDYHHSQDSFIKLGILRQLPEKNIYAYPYNHETIGNSLNEFLDDIVSGITDNLNKLDKTEKFCKNNNGHIALLIFELISLFKALKLGEVTDYLEILGINILPNLTKRLIFLLNKLSLITCKRIGNINYYLPMSDESRIKFSSENTSKLFDRSAAHLGTLQFYLSSDKEKMRKKVIDESNK